MQHRGGSHVAQDLGDPRGTGLIPKGRDGPPWNQALGVLRCEAVSGTSFVGDGGQAESTRARNAMSLHSVTCQGQEESPLPRQAGQRILSPMLGSIADTE